MQIPTLTSVFLPFFFLCDFQEKGKSIDLCLKLATDCAAFFLMNTQITTKVLAQALPLSGAFTCLLNPFLFFSPLLGATFSPFAYGSFCCFLETVGNFMVSDSLPFPSGTGILISVLHSSREKEALLGFMLFTSLATNEGLPLWVGQIGTTCAM